MSRRSASIGIVMALAGSLFVAQPVAAADRQAPKIVKALLKDANNNGNADRVVLVYSERVKHKADKDGSYPFTVEGYQVRKVARSEGKKLVILLKDAAGPDKPLVRYERSRRQPVKDRAGNQAAPQVFRKVVPFGAELPPGSAQLVTVPTGPGQVLSDEGLIACGDACSAVLPLGTEVPLTAAPDQGAVFLGWGGACQGTAPVCTVTLDENETVSARFGWPVTIAVEDGGTVASEDGRIACPPGCTASYAPGTKVTLSATADEGSSFSGWAGACSGSESTCSFSVTEPVAVSASFATGTDPEPLPSITPVPLPTLTLSPPLG